MIPAETVAGDSISWTGAFPDYPSASGWEILVVLRGTDGENREIPTTAQPADEYVAKLKASETADWTPGVTEWFITAHDPANGVRVQLSSGTIRIKPDPQGDDGLHAVRERIRYVEAAITARLKNDTSVRYTVGGQSHDKMTLPELYAARDAERAELRQIIGRRRRLATGQRSRRTVRTVFTG